MRYCSISSDIRSLQDVMCIVIRRVMPGLSVRSVLRLTTSTVQSVFRVAVPELIPSVRKSSSTLIR